MLQNHAQRALSPSNARYHPFKLSRSTATPLSANAPPHASGSAHQGEASFLPAQHTRETVPCPFTAPPSRRFAAQRTFQPFVFRYCARSVEKSFPSPSA